MREQAEVWAEAGAKAAYAGLASGIYCAVGVACLFPLSLYVLQGPTVSAANLAAVSISFGLFAGALVALIMGAMTLRAARRNGPQTTNGLRNNDAIEYQENARHFLNYEARGGQLCLTSQNLIFRPHALNMQLQGIVIPRNQIASATRWMVLGILPNAILVITRDGTWHRFAVPHRREWVRRLA